MKNPFVKQDHTFLIASIAVGSLAAGAAAYLFLTESGAETREKLFGKIKEGFKEATAGIVDKVTGLTKKADEVMSDEVAG